MVSKTLKEFESVLSTQNFFRINRSCIVNIDYIVKYKNEDGGILELQDGSEVGVGPHRKNELIDLLARIWIFIKCLHQIFCHKLISLSFLVLKKKFLV